jgi:hypothetical protein
VVTATEFTIRIDDVLSVCPSGIDAAYLTGEVDLGFESDPTGPDLVCREADGSADLTRLQERAVQALVVMEYSEFDEPLPWTDLSLFDWFRQTIDGIRFRGDIDMSFCCDPAGYLNIQTGNLAVSGTTRWIDPASGTGLIDLVALFVHEARHNEGLPHTCESNDQTVLEMGAWAVEALLYRWYAEHADQTFFDTTDRPGYYAESASQSALRILDTRICEQ